MKRVILSITVLMLLAGPLTLAPTPSVSAASQMRIETKERGSGNPIPYACYTVADLIRGGGIGTNHCDEDGDGTTIITSDDPCTSCRVGQSLPDDPNTGLPTNYLLEPSQDGGFSATYTFENFLKPYLVVTARDARTDKLIEGVCIAIADVDQGGAAAGGCDGAASDLDGQRNGKIETKRLGHAGNYRVDQTVVPAGYLKGPAQSVIAEPSLPGEFHAVAITVIPKPRIVIKTVDSKTGKKIKGACYAIADTSHGGGLGTHCDGVQSGTFGDQDGRKNGIIVTRQVEPGHTYLIDQTTAPQGYRLAKKDKTVEPVAGKDAAVTFKNRSK